MNSLNALYLILLKDRATNYTKIWSDPLLKRLRQLTTSLNDDFHSLRLEYSTRITHAHLEEEQANLMEKHGFPKLELEQIHSSNVSTLSNLDVLISTLDRVLEVLKS